MLVYILRRLLWTPVLLLLAAFFVFFMGTVAPGDPAELRLGNRATPERVDRLREQLGLNDPLPIRYMRFIGNALKGDLGESYVFQGKTVTSLIGPRLLVSVQLNIAASIVALSVGLPLGFYAAKRQGTKTDPAILISMLILYAMPVFFTAPFLILFFAVKLHWVPASGWNGMFSTQVILPALTIGIPGAAIFVRHMRASTLEVIGQEYIRTARAKGMSNFVINYRHVARNAFLPILTLLGFTLAGIFGGSLIVELIYGIPGVSRLSLDAIFQRDFPVLTALVLLGSLMLVLANLVIDIAYTIIDPRIRLK
ncbi:MAG: ABC transporter permease [SAR202 cluster bacterium]|jgi:peptide/nickel transport system permease protein|nr:MAG: ABC transporter permease [SAR202 cluster bacterium]KAA1302086.1 MAG: ABC transporter permease [SAR202 cluster bacterium]MCH2530915.1 ABC transporter permease [Dehalococcoidia bacterium]